MVYVAWGWGAFLLLWGSEEFMVGGCLGMVGTSLSGVTFISVPGTVSRDHWGYLQVVIGYSIGYWVVAGILLPLYYRLQLTSIYTYLRQRFGVVSYRTGSGIFIVSRLVGATIRIYIVLNVIHEFLLKDIELLPGYRVPFWLNAAVVMLMIFLYTIRGGVKTIVWTDTLQTLFMLMALVGTILYIVQSEGMQGWVDQLRGSEMVRVFDWDWKKDNFFLKQIVSGIFVTIAMTGLDQEMMQKNLSVRTLKDAQKNMLVFSGVLFFVNTLFLLLGALLYLKASQLGLELPAKSDALFPTMALQQFPVWISLLFIIGLISALFPSADGALTALTASTCIDFLGIQERGLTEAAQARIRKTVHFAMTIVFMVLILWFHWRQDSTIISILLKLAGLTYGPLLGLFSFGILTRRKVTEGLVPVVCLGSATATFFLQKYSESLFFGYQMGFETLLVNAVMTFVLLWLTGPRRGG